jgi:hypothetical protein
VAGLSAPKPFCAPAAERRLLSDLNDNTGGDSDENGRRKEVSERWRSSLFFSLDENGNTDLKVFTQGLLQNSKCG